MNDPLAFIIGCIVLAGGLTMFGAEVGSGLRAIAKYLTEKHEGKDQ